MEWFWMTIIGGVAIAIWMFVNGSNKEKERKLREEKFAEMEEALKKKADEERAKAQA